ncbi:MAG: hypothetical protein NTW87_11720 [Planctomycetota bacterium]|nr:hypothetical protein [Planctomycetota bacterium]
MNIKALAKRLCRLDYEAIEAEVAGFDDAVLLVLLDSSSRKVGDTAAELLCSRGKAKVVVAALLASEIRTKLGRIRAMSVLGHFGKRVPRGAEAYLRLIEEKSATVVYDALFGLVFLQDEANIPMIEAARRRSRAGPKADGYFEKALTAIHAKDPFIFSPGYRDAHDVWGLDKERFGNRVG